MKRVKLILAIGVLAGIIAMMCRLLPLMTGAEGDIQSIEKQQEISETASEAASDAVSVCIIDSGCSQSGAQGKNYLAEIQKSETDEISDSSQDLTDTTGHGTAVYQILSETAPDAQLYMLKCFEDFEELSARKETAIIQAIYDAVDVYQADIINMSWTLNTEREPLHEALGYAS